MGYRSDVRCLIYGTKEEMDLLLTTSVIICNSKILEHFKKDLTRYTSRILGPNGVDEVILHFLDLSGENWKWYDDYEDVKTWVEFMKEAAEMGLEYEFIRVGERAGDVETISSAAGTNFLYTTSPHIECDIDISDPIPIL